MEQENQGYNANENESGTYQAASEPVVDTVLPKKKRFYQKWWFWAIAAVVVIGLFALLLGGSAVEEDLTEYINEDLKEVKVLHNTLDELYEAARESDSDYEFYEMLDEVVIPKSRELIDKAEAVEVETEEVRLLHEKYLSALNTQDQAFTLILAAIENDDYATLTQANEKLDEARRLYREYKAELEALMDEHGLEWE